MRSLEVTLSCGSETVIKSIDEPSTCTYVATMETPAVCSESDLDF